MTTAGLVALTIASLILAIAGLSRDEPDDPDDATAELGAGGAGSEANLRAEAAERERDELADQLEELDGQLAASEATVDSLTTELDEADAANEQLTTDLAAETERADVAEAELAAIGEVYPIEVDSGLDPELMSGTYVLALTQVFCEGNAPCGRRPPALQATVSDGGSGTLALTVEGLIDAGLANFGGSLFAVGTSRAAFPPCPAGDRTAHVAVTMWADDVLLEEDGTRTVLDIGGSISIAAPASGDDCAFGFMMYSATFTPAG